MTGNNNDTMQSDICEAFGSGIGNDLITKCISLCTNLNIPATVMAESWEAYAMNKNISEFDDLTFDPFRNYLMKEKLPAPDAITSRDTGAVIKRRRMDNKPPISSSTPLTPPPSSKLPATTPKVSPEKIINSYNTRTDSNKIILSYDPHKIPLPSVPHPGSFSTFEPSPFNITRPYRHMFTTLTAKATALNDRLSRMTAHLTSDHQITLHPIGTPHQDVIWVVGRIVNDAPTGRLNPTAIMIEGCKEISHGQRISVDVSHLEWYSLFPGQIVALKGMNPTGRTIVVEQIHDGYTLPLPPSLSEQKKSPRRIMCVAGPYSLCDDGYYTPLIDFLTRVREERPSLVIMTGPFISENLETLPIEDGTEVPATYETAFRVKVAALWEELEGTGCETCFLVVPSGEDVLSEGVFPQPPLGAGADGRRNVWEFSEEDVETGSLGFEELKTVKSVSNPASFQWEGYSVGVTSTDVLMHLSSEEIHKNLPENRLSILAKHVLRQGSFYPIFPGHKDVLLDWKQAERWELREHPDLLILPSRLAPLARKVGETLVVNPGRLSKGRAGGTFADVWMTEEGEKVEIRKI